jgi:hypothetical protein
VSTASKSPAEAVAASVPTTAFAAEASPVVTVADLTSGDLDSLAAKYGLRLVGVDRRAEIPGSYWGDSEAGLLGDALYVRADTPAHSALHELCHYVCMDDSRRAVLATDAGGSDDEECGVCYLEVLLADELRGFGGARCLADMDAWGYSFREGSARAWWAGDARFARDWLLERYLIDANDEPTFKLRGASGARESLLAANEVRR